MKLDFKLGKDFKTVILQHHYNGLTPLDIYDAFNKKILLKEIKETIALGNITIKAEHYIIIESIMNF